MQLKRLFAEGPKHARAVMELSGHTEDETWRRAVEMGLTATAIPESLGGLGLTALEQCVIAEECGTSLIPLPLMTSMSATEALKLAGGDIASQWLARLATGDVLATLALNEGMRGTWDEAPTASVAAGRLTGEKTPVADAGMAGIAIVSARAAEDGDGYGWWVVPLEGVSRLPVVTIDLVRKHSTLRFADSPALRLGQPGTGAAMADHLLDVAAVYTAFEQLGGAEALLSVCVAHAKQRRAFGSPIGVNQAVKHKLADMYTKIELARGHSYYGAWALASAPSELPLAAAGARLAATDAFCFAAEEAVELHGAIGFTWENDCSLYLRRARLLAQTLGNQQRWADRLVAALEHRRQALH